MLKKFFRLATTLTLLIGCYLGYTRVFAVVVGRLTAARRVDDVAFVSHDSMSKGEAIVRAREAFGPKHWTANENLQLRYFNPERGFWMYSENYRRSLDEDPDGKRLRLNPAAIIWRARDGSSTKTITSDEAIIDFNQSLGFNSKPDSDPLTVKFARLIGHVIIRDDRGTPANPSDDMVIGPLTYLDFDDDELQIRSESDVLIVDRDLRITGAGMLIQLRPKTAGPASSGVRTSGFEGAQSARLMKNIHIQFSDVGKSGILPGSAKKQRSESGQLLVTASARADADETLRTRGPGLAAEPVPLDLQAEGPMQVDLPRPQIQPVIGPPGPPAPTLVHFTRNVVVRRGKLSELPDQLDCDNLDLTLMPSEKPEAKPTNVADPGKRGLVRESAANPPGTKMASAPATDEGESKTMFGNQTLRRAKATGHAVWLQLPAQGAKVRCNELIHEKHMPESPDRTYFRSDSTRKLWMVEKQDLVREGPDRGKVESVTHVWAMDATLLDSGGEMDDATLVARGPGLLETRPAPGGQDSPTRDVPPDRTAVWQDQLVLKNEFGPDQKLERKILILKGQPRVVDRLQQSSLDAIDSIVVWLKPVAPAIQPAGDVAANGEKSSGGTGGQGGKFQINRLLALRNVHLLAPGKNLNARERLDADFVEGAGLLASSVPPSGTTTRTTLTGPQTTASQTAIAATPDKPAPEEKPAEPPMTAMADRVKAKIVIGPEAGDDAKTGTLKLARSSATAPGSPGSNYEVREVRMWGGVNLHQDAAPGKTKGQDAHGEVLILLSGGAGKAVLNVYHRDPTLGRETPEKARAWPPATVSNEDMSIEGEIIGFNQQTDQAWVNGPGKLVQWTDRSLLTDKAKGGGADVTKLAPPGNGQGQVAVTGAAKPGKRAGKALDGKVPLTITWGERMVFHGRTTDPEKRPAARAEFYKNVRAEMEDALLYCTKTMITYTDQPVPLAQFGKMDKPGSEPRGSEDLAPGAEGEGSEKPKPDLASIDCIGNAVAISRKVDPDRPVLLSLQKLVGDRLIYDRRSGDFRVPGAGMVYLYDRGNNNPNSQPSLEPDAPIANRRTIRPTSGPPQRTRRQGTNASAPRTAAGRIPGRAGSDRPPAVPALQPLVLTQIRFAREMKGRLGTGKQDDTTEPRWADFFDDIEVARGPVSSERVTFNYDKLPPKDCYFLTSQTLRVIQEPPPAGSPEKSPGRNLLKAWENAYVTTSDSTIQADEVTYDSGNDLILALGKDGRQVIVAQQAGVGQPASPMRARAVQMNPKTGAAQVIAPEAVQMFDARTGVRPTPVAPPNPNAKVPKPKKPIYRTPSNSWERKGFTGM